MRPISPLFALLFLVLTALPSLQAQEVNDTELFNTNKNSLSIYVLPLAIHALNNFEDRLEVSALYRKHGKKWDFRIRPVYTRDRKGYLSAYVENADSSVYYQNPNYTQYDWQLHGGFGNRILCLGQVCLTAGADLSVGVTSEEWQVDINEVDSYLYWYSGARYVNQVPPGSEFIDAYEIQRNYLVAGLNPFVNFDLLLQDRFIIGAQIAANIEGYFQVNKSQTDPSIQVEHIQTSPKDFEFEMEYFSVYFGMRF